MAKFMMRSVYVLAIVLLLAAVGYSQEKYHEKYWLQGKVKGNIRGRVITLELVDMNGNFQAETSANKFGWYAFSAMNRGKPSEYKIIVYAGNSRIKTVSLKGVRAGGYAPAITIK